ncbi:hypothetical protein EV702DRAFT_1048187 [Suillus placidus]|uniref:Uncharacterized protein n=1 Tax=Suillus placidus TaxID=48579 RepID=A0A9P6ZP15_9AGAM|nr:hypothetical protein EV702DRAFT_1048187 [Suillus placidus]
MFINCFGSSTYIPSTIYTTASTMVMTQKALRKLTRHGEDPEAVTTSGLCGRIGAQRHISQLSRPDSASRKFIDIIFKTSSKWDTFFLKIDRKTGVLQVEGNIHDEAFQESLKQQGLIIDLSHPSCQPIKGAVEEDMVMSSIDVKRGEISVTPYVFALDLASASFKAEFQFQEGRRGAVLVMHKPQQEYIPQGRVLSIIHEAHQLKDRYISSSTFTCPCVRLTLCFFGGSILKAQLSGREDWFEQTFRGAEVHPTEDDLWPDCPLPWDPLDDGNEDTVYEEPASSSPGGEGDTPTPAKYNPPEPVEFVVLRVRVLLSTVPKSTAQKMMQTIVLMY